jgi:zinc protease
MAMLPLLAFLTLGTSLAEAADAPTIPFTRYQLDNGLDVILAPDNSTPIVYVSVWYHVGSKDETQGLTGFAHLFEHLMFQGSLSSPDDYFGPLQAVGASINGTTSFDRTNYFQTLPSRYLPLALFMESDRMGSLLPVLDQTKLDNQREVVRNERRQRYENPPYGEAFKDLFSYRFEEGHPYHHMPIGSHEDLEAANLDDVSAFFKKWYVPNNASLVVSGDFDETLTRRLILENFGGIPRGADPERCPLTDGPISESKVIRQYHDVLEQRVWIAFNSPRIFEPGDADLDLLSSVLADGKDSRLYKRLVKEKRLAKTVSVSQFSSLHASTYLMTATAAPGATTDQVVAEAMLVIEDLLESNPPTTEEIESARAGYEASFYRSLQTISGKGETLQRYNMYQGDPGYMARDLARYQGVTGESMVEWGRRVLRAPHVALHIWPEADRPKESN